MATTKRLSLILASAFLAGTLSSSALAQVPTVPQVEVDLQTSCIVDAGGAVVDVAVCLAAVDRAIATAAAYALLEQVPPQVDIGFLICQLLLTRPSLAQPVIDRINLSGNVNLALGCSNALGPNWTGPRPVISPT